MKIGEPLPGHEASSCDRAAAGNTVRRLAADYLHLYGGRSEAGLTQAARAMQRFVSNPSLHAVAQMRATLASPPSLGRVWRNRLIRRYSIYIDDDVELGGGLILPHPFGIVLGRGVRIGDNVMLYHNTTVGTLPEGEDASTVVCDGTIVHANSVIARGVRLGAGAVIGANSYVANDVPPGVVFSRGRVLRRRNESN